MEMMDRPAIHAAEAFVNIGYPLDVEALLIVELDGVAAECDHLIDKVADIARANGSTTLRLSSDEQERMGFWAGRKAAFPAVGRRSEEHTSELQSLMRNSYAVFCLQKQKRQQKTRTR